MGLPARITGGYRSGKTTRLQGMAAECERPLVLCATEAAAARFGPYATTFWGLAAEIVRRHAHPVRVLSTAEQRSRLGDPELADVVCHYRASFLGLEELRTHADAAGVAERWEAMALMAERYQSDLAAAGEADWAGVLVQASLLLRDDDILAAERDRFDVALVDDFEAASFAANRLLSQLAGFGGPVVVAGNADNAVWRHVGGSPVYLDRFVRRFGAAVDVTLAEDHGVDADAEGTAVLVLEEGGDPWLALPDGPVPVALSTSLTWESVTVVPAAGTVGETDDAGGGGVEHVYDLDLLRGPDVPDAAARAERRRREDEARVALAL
ncbi:MAG: ATP-dependent helicase UvrD/PcrA, partial [Acidimicrobiaceae bacterium]|nr:ATP-dependent helicase UvrD/PcrA [Acidimicrobiaceae bacterium]